MLSLNKVKRSSNSQEIVKLLMMMILTIFTQVIMFIKTGVIASTFGISQEMDAFNLANSIGTFIYSFIGAGVTTVLIPNLINKDKKDSINIFISILYSIAFILLIIVSFLRKYLVSNLSVGNKQFIMLTCNIMLITLITQYINSFSGVTNAIFQCSGKFNFPKFVTLGTSSILVLLIIMSKDLTIYKYCIYILFTTIINIILQIYLAIKDGYLFKYKIDFKNEELKKMIRIFIPTMLSTGLYQVSLLTDSIISSNLGAGEISKLSYSNNIMTLINSVILTNIMTYFYPKIAKNIQKEDGQKRLFDLSLLINAIMILIVVGFVTVGREGIVILYERGKFMPSTTSVVYTCTLIYIIGLPINAFRDLIYRYFYAKGDTVTPFKNSLIVSCLNIIISIILARFIGIYGVILGTVITSYMSFIMIFLKFKNKFEIKYSKKILLLENLKLICGGFITIISVKLFRYIMPNFSDFNTFILFGLISVMIYCSIIYLIKCKAISIKFSE